MIVKEKNNDVALRSLSKIFDDIQTQTRTGNFGFIFSSSYTINPYVKLFPSTRNLCLVDAFESLSANVATLFLLPPPTRFSGNYRTTHAKGALALMKTGVLIWFDRVVHSKFLLFWSFDSTQFIEHRRYYGSTNFTKGGLITNIEEFYHNNRGWRHAVNPKSHSFYLDTALKRVEEVTKLYTSPDHWTKNLDGIQNKIQGILSDLKERVSSAKDLIEKLRLSMLSYSYMLDVLSDLWNLPGKKFAYTSCEELLTKVDSYAAFNLEFLEELMIWPDKTLIEFIEQWEIDTNRYFEIPSKVIGAFPLLEDDIKKYKEKGYESFFYSEEKEFIEKLNDRSRAESLKTIRKIMSEPQKELG